MKGVKHKGNHHYGFLARRTILAILSVSLTPLILTVGIVIHYYNSAYHHKVVEHLQELVQKHAQQVDGFLQDRLAAIRFLVQISDLEQLADPAYLRRKLELLRGEYGGVYVDLGLVAEDGIQVAYAGPFNLEKANYAKAGWFKKALGQEQFISDVFMGLRGSPHFIVAVTKGWQDHEWVFRATIDFEAFNSLVENLSIGRTGFAFILNRKGEFQTRPRFEVTPNRGPYLESAKEDLKSKRVRVVERPNQAGKSAIFVMAPLKGGEWVLCVQQEVADAETALDQGRKLMAGVILVGGLAISLVAFLLSRRMIRRLRRADSEKEVMNQQIVESGRLAAIGELAAGIAHEINNPVAIMVEEAGWLEDLLEDLKLPSGESSEEFRRSLNQIRTQGRRCKEITHKLLSFARKTETQEKDLDLNLVVEEILGLFQQKARYASVHLEKDLSAEAPVVFASSSEIQQVLMNLVNNAVDAMDSGGGTIKVSTRREDGLAVVEVADTGRGIPEANLVRIFDPFFTTKPVGQGTGLGLSIVYGLVKKAGGDIKVKSTVGAGSTFIVTLPLKSITGQATPSDKEEIGS